MDRSTDRFMERRMEESTDTTSPYYFYFSIPPNISPMDIEKLYLPPLPPTEREWERMRENGAVQPGSATYALNNGHMPWFDPRTRMIELPPLVKSQPTAAMSTEVSWMEQQAWQPLEKVQRIRDDDKMKVSLPSFATFYAEVEAMEQADQAAEAAKAAQAAQAAQSEQAAQAAWAAQAAQAPQSAQAPERRRALTIYELAL